MKKMAVFAILLIGIAGPATAWLFRPTALVNRITKKCDFQSVVTVGNHSYLPINNPGSPGIDENAAKAILETLNQFEKAHPEWTFPPGGWRIESQPDVKKSTPWGYWSSDANDASGRAFTFGLWVDHLPKEPVAPVAQN